MQVLVVAPERKPEAREIDSSLESMQNIVGGLIQSIYPFEDEEIVLVCHDEGKLLGLPLNRASGMIRAKFMILSAARSLSALPRQRATTLPA